MNALSPPDCPLCTKIAPATNALLQAVVLLSLTATDQPPQLSSTTRVETGLADLNPTITFKLKAYTLIKAVVLLGAFDRQDYLTNTDIFINFDAESY
jgi:hypothetical protein